MKKQILAYAMLALTLIASGCSKKTPTEDLKETLKENSKEFTHEEYGKVELCEYKGIKAEKPIYTVSQDDIDSYVESLIYEHAESNIVERPAKEGDYISLNFTMSYNGEILYDYSEETYYLYIGDEEFGAEFDSKIIGKSAGDTEKFSISYDADYEDTECAGKTIDYDITVTEVCEETYPELTDEFINSTLGYDSYDDMIKEINKELTKENEYESDYSVKENIILHIIQNSTFNEYSSELYTSCKDSIEEGYAEYAQMFGCETAEELYEMFGMTEEDVESEIMNQVYRIIVIDAISEKEGLSLTNTEYTEGLNTYAEDMGYETSEDLVKDYGEESLYMWLLEEKVLDFLTENAVITEVEYDEEDIEE